MLRLLKCEFKKFRGTYINVLSALGMLSPVVLVTLVFVFGKSRLLNSGGYTWQNYIMQLTVFFIFLVGPIITSFISVFSVFYEFQEGTMKNVLAGPNGRNRIILSKILYTMAFVVLQYILVAVISSLSGLLLGFGLTLDGVVKHAVSLIVAGLATMMLIPMMTFVTLLFRSFIPAMVLTISGTISNILVANWEKSYISPWFIPADIMLITDGKLPMKLEYPLAGLCIYFVVFMLATLIYFNRADQNA